MDPRTCAVGVRSKIDESGNFLKFQGVTVVASANSKVNLILWQHLHDSLSSIPIVTNHFSLLPIESYHMTTMSDAATQRELKSCLDHVFEGYRGRRMHLGAPHLCYFRDMTQFTAWTAERNPYSTHSN